MAVYRIFPEKTATIYSRYPLYNAGLDEIMEIDSYYIGTNSYVARSLIAFNTAEQLDVVDNIIGSTNFTASIKMYLAEGEEAPTSYSIYAYPLSNTWDRGTGHFGDVPYATDGVNWMYSRPSIYWPSPLPTNTTASYNPTVTDVEGGVWYTGSLGTGSMYYQSHGVDSTHDLEIDVTPSIHQHYQYHSGEVSAGIPNYGFILKLDDSNEFQTSRNIFLKYFSGNTHTIYPPALEYKWNDFAYSSTLSTIATDNINITIKGNRGTYTDEGKQRFRLHVKPKYPTRSFSTTSNYLTNYKLPSGALWGIRDEHTEEMVINFDSNFTKISADNESSYFDIYMNGLQPERHYRVLIKATIDGSTAVFDEDIVFKVVRNG